MSHVSGTNLNHLENRQNLNLIKMSKNRVKSKSFMRNFTMLIEFYKTRNRIILQDWRKQNFGSQALVRRCTKGSEQWLTIVWREKNGRKLGKTLANMMIKKVWISFVIYSTALKRTTTEMTYIQQEMIDICVVLINIVLTFCLPASVFHKVSRANCAVVAIQVWKCSRLQIRCPPLLRGS